MEAVHTDTIHIPFTTKDPTDGTNVDADSTPTISIYEEGSSTALAYTGGTVVDRTAAGVYSVPLVLSTANGFDVGSYYEVWVSATVSSTAYGPEPVATIKVTSAGLGDIAYPTAIAYGGTAPTGEIETVTWSTGDVWTYNYTGSDLTSITKS